MWSQFFSLFLFGVYRYLVGSWVPFLLKNLKPFLKNGKIKQSLELRQQGLRELKTLQKKSALFSSPSPSRPLPWVWFHCASGEVEYAKPLLRALQQKKEAYVLLTYFSPSLLPLLKKEKTKLVDMLLPLPWDRPYPMRLILKLFSPKALLLAHTDLWPEMLYQAKKAGVPILYFSVHCPSFSLKNLSFFKKVFWNFFSHLLTEVHCIEEKDRKGLQKAFPFLKVETGGNTRVDEMVYKQKAQKNSSEWLFSLFSQCKAEKELIFIAGSTWPKDEDFFLSLAQHFFSKQKAQTTG